MNRALLRRAAFSTLVLCSLLVSLVAQGAPGRDGKYRMRMTDSLVEMVHSAANQVTAAIGQMSTTSSPSRAYMTSWRLIVGFTPPSVR